MEVDVAQFPNLEKKSKFEDGHARISSTTMGLLFVFDVLKAKKGSNWEFVFQNHFVWGRGGLSSITVFFQSP